MERSPSIPCKLISDDPPLAPDSSADPVSDSPPTNTLGVEAIAEGTLTAAQSAPEDASNSDHASAVSVPVTPQTPEPLPLSPTFPFESEESVTNREVVHETGALSGQTNGIHSKESSPSHADAPGAAGAHREAPAAFDKTADAPEKGT